jgi:hypothetical protein
LFQSAPPQLQCIKAHFQDAAHPEPTMEDAFVALIEEDTKAVAA